MQAKYDLFASAFLEKITEYQLFYNEENIDASIETIDGYMKRAMTAFRRVSKYNLYESRNDAARTFELDDSISAAELDEICDIISEGMVVQWLKTYLYKQELLENLLNTRDFTSYSPANLLKEVGAAYNKASENFTQMIREYSYNTGNLRNLHT
jgi:hypothetical protein